MGWFLDSLLDAKPGWTALPWHRSRGSSARAQLASCPRRGVTAAPSPTRTSPRMGLC